MQCTLPERVSDPLIQDLDTPLSRGGYSVVMTRTW